jgi:hypothetical protein
VLYSFFCLCILCGFTRIMGCVLLNLYVNKEGLICNSTNSNSIDDSHSTVRMTSPRLLAFGSVLFTSVRVYQFKCFPFAIYNCVCSRHFQIHICIEFSCAIFAVWRSCALRNFTVDLGRGITSLLIRQYCLTFRHVMKDGGENNNYR